MVTVFCARDLFLLVLASHCFFLETEVTGNCPQQVLALPLSSDALKLPDFAVFYRAGHFIQRDCPHAFEVLHLSFQQQFLAIGQLSTASFFFPSDSFDVLLFKA